MSLLKSRKQYAALAAGTLAAVVAVMSSVTGSESQNQPPPSFLETFDHPSSSPSHYVPPGWDVSVIAHEDDSIELMQAEHGPNCEPPDEVWTRGTQPNSTHNHVITTAAQATFSCADHIMTSMNAGYGAIYMTPPALLDFRNGPAVLEWDMSTQRTSSRDWIDVMILPFEPTRTDLQPPMALNMQDFHTPTSGLQVELVGGGNVLMPHTFMLSANPGCGAGSYFKGPVYDCRFSFDGYHTWDMKLDEVGLAASATRRNHFRIEVSRTHLKVGFQPVPGSAYFNWVDSDIPAGLAFDQALVQLNQRAYNPLKPCGPGVGDAGHVADGWEGNCRAATWHWDNVALSPSVPIKIIPGQRKTASGGTVTFPEAAPASGAFFKAAGSSGTEYSLNGTNWQRLPVVGPAAPAEVGDSFWLPVPAGTTQVRIRNGSIQDSYLYVRNPGAAAPPPTLPPAPTMPVATVPPAVPTRTPTATATRTPVPTATRTVTPVAAATDTPTSIVPTSTSVPAAPTATATVVPTVPPDTCYIRAVHNGADILVAQAPEFCSP